MIDSSRIFRDLLICVLALSNNIFHQIFALTCCCELEYIRSLRRSIISSTFIVFSESWTVDELLLFVWRDISYYIKSGKWLFSTWTISIVSFHIRKRVNVNLYLHRKLLRLKWHFPPSNRSKVVVVGFIG